MRSENTVRPVERVVDLSSMPAWVRHEHEARYQWAASLVEGKRVLDVARGTGYDVPWLRDGGAVSVDGFDVPGQVTRKKSNHASTAPSDSSVQASPITPGVIPGFTPVSIGNQA